MSDQLSLFDVSRFIVGDIWQARLICRPSVWEMYTGWKSLVRGCNWATADPSSGMLPILSVIRIFPQIIVPNHAQWVTLAYFVLFTAAYFCTINHRSKCTTLTHCRWTYWRIQKFVNGFRWLKCHCCASSETAACLFTRGIGMLLRFQPLFRLDRGCIIGV